MIKIFFQASMPNAPTSVFKRFLEGPSRKKYDPQLRAFALTLNFYSPKAYNFVRDTFNNSLPHSRTLQKWYQSVEGSPGFTQEALNAIRMKVEDARRIGSTVVCNMVMDEMAIRKKVEWTGDKVVGYVDCGTGIDTDCTHIAREALVFMLVAVNAAWKVPVAYFFINGLTALEKAALVSQCLEQIHTTGALVASLTFDGTITNLSMCKNLGANLNINGLKPYFEHPITKHKVFIFMDACHMIKLIRNCLGTKKIIGVKNNKVEWRYFDLLVELQNDEGLHAGTKLRYRHVEWAQEKMKVRLATQTFSKSVADAFLYLCEDLKLESFAEVQETAKFALIFNNVFDILNSRTQFAKYDYQKALSPDTKELFFNTMTSTIDYIKSLKLDGEPILNTIRKTGFLGIIVCCTSLMEYYKIYVEEQQLLKYLLSYKFSQDHLEIFFSVVRSRGGFNNNPTCRQFQSTFKRLLIHAEIKGASGANAVALDATSILQCSSKDTVKQNSQGDVLVCFNNYHQETIESDHDYHVIHQPWHLSEYTIDIISYISGFVVKSIKKQVKCVKCLQILEGSTSISKLQDRKEYGRLTKSSTVVHKICLIAEKSFRLNQAKIDRFLNKPNLKPILINDSLSKIPRSLLDAYGDHFYDGDIFNNHIIILFKMILNSYFNIRLFHESNKIDKQKRIRSQLTKYVLFQHQ